MTLLGTMTSSCEELRVFEERLVVKGFEERLVIIFLCSSASFFLSTASIVFVKTLLPRARMRSEG